MANLNEDVEEGLALEEDLVDVNEQTDVIDIPTSNPNQPEPEPVLLVPNESADKRDFVEPSINDLFGLGVTPGEVPNFKGEFEIIQNKRNSLIDFEETAQVIKDKRIISQEDAKLLDALIPGFINKNHLIGYYTKDASQTYFKESILAMENIINNEENQISERLKNHIDILITHYNSLITLFNTEFRDKLNNQSTFLKNILEHDVVFDNDVFHKYFKSDINFIEFIDTPINQLDAEKLSDLQKIKDLINDLKSYYNNINLKSYLISFRYNCLGSLVFVNNRSEDLNNGFKLSEVFNIHKGSTQIDLSTKILLILIDNEKELNNLRNKAVIYRRRISGNTPEDINVTEESVISITQEYNYLLNLSLNLNKFNDAISKLVVLFT